MADRWKITYLRHKGARVMPARPLDVRACGQPDFDRFYRLYTGVGGDYLWTDLLAENHQVMRDYLGARPRHLYELYDREALAGFYVLSTPTPGQVSLDYFGLMPTAIGRGLGGALLDHAINAAFAHHGAEIIDVNTCTLDHPRALSLYTAKGFEPRFCESHRDLP